MTQQTLTVQKRKVLGRKVKSLRNQGLLPANIYGKKIKSLAVQVSDKDFTKVFKETGETNLINVLVEKEAKKRPVLATNLQKDPITDVPIHVDFHQVDLSQKVTVAIPIEITGISPAVKEKGGVLITILDEIKVEALPKDLPDKFVVDVSNLKEFGSNVTVLDLKLDKKKITLLTEEKEAIIVVQEPKKEEEPEPPEAVAEEETEEETEEQVTEKTEETQQPQEEKQQNREEKEKKKEKEKTS